MKSFKRIDENTVVVDGIVWTTNISKRTYMKTEDGFEIESIVIGSVRYFPSKKA
jgi:hypothetical protein